MPVKRYFGLGARATRDAVSAVGTGQYIWCLPPSSVWKVRRRRSEGCFMKEWMSVVVIVNGVREIETSRLANGVALALISGTGARVILLVIPRLFVTLARDMAMFFNGDLSLGAGSKCSTSLSSSGTPEILRIVRNSPILKYRGSLRLVLNRERNERYLDMREGGLRETRQAQYMGIAVRGSALSAESQN